MTAKMGFYAAAGFLLGVVGCMALSGAAAFAQTAPATKEQLETPQPQDDIAGCPPRR